MVTFAPLGQTGVYAPIHATVGTQIGTVTISARAFRGGELGAWTAPPGEDMGRATLIGFSAVAMWALLALLTDASGKVPPFLLSAITFAIGTCVGLVARLFMPAAGRSQKIPPQVWADRHCRPVRLPLLLLHRAAQRAGGRGEPDRLSVAAADRARLGADAGRTAALEPCRRRAAGPCRHGADRHQGRRASPSTRAMPSATRWPPSARCLWSSYSLLSRRFPSVPTSIVTWFCAATAMLSLALPSGAGSRPCCRPVPASGWPCSASA